MKEQLTQRSNKEREYHFSIVSWDKAHEMWVFHHHLKRKSDDVIQMIKIQIHHLLGQIFHYFSTYFMAPRR